MSPNAKATESISGVRIPGIRCPLGGREAAEAVDVESIPFLLGNYTEFGVEAFGLTGDAPKSYIIFNTGGERESEAYIAKAPRKEGPIECVTEYLISRIGLLLPLRVAKGGLVRLPRPPGTPPDVRFLSRQFLDRAAKEQLIHGAQLVAGCFEIEERELFQEVRGAKEWQFYTVDLVDEVLGKATNAAEEHARLRAAFARMIAFDAIIGANDRHAQNWGIIKKTSEGGGPLRFAPIFDTARGLFWNHREETLESRDSTGRRNSTIEGYANGSEPLIAFATQNRPNHFDLIEHMVERSRPYRGPILEVIKAFSPDRVARVLHVEFRRLLTRRRLEYIDALLRFRHAKLKAVCGLK